MEKNEFWICPECGSQVKMNRIECWRCRFATNDVSKYKYNYKSELLDKIKKMTIIFISIIAVFSVVVYFIIAIEHFKKQEKLREKQQWIAYKEKKRQDSIKRLEIEREEWKQKWEKEGAEALKKINMLEKQYDELLMGYGRVLGNAYLEIEVTKKLLGTLRNINRLAKGSASHKYIRNIEDKVSKDLCELYALKLF